MILTLSSIILLFTASQASTSSDVQPNIIFMFADDWGFNDVGFNGNTNTETPFIDNLAKEESIILSHNYVTPLCTISRASFLTGRYSFRYGMQHYVLKPHSNYALTLQESLISNEFQNAGYSTHMIGKWHLGMIAKEYTPTYRGFDTFHGYYLGRSHYYDHTYELMQADEPMEFKDLRVNEDPAGSSCDGIFGPYWERDRVLDLLEEESTSDTPFFMYIGWQASHSPSESEQEIFEKYNTGDNKVADEELDNDDNPWVRRFNMQAQTESLDSAIGDVVNYLKSSGLWDNTLIVFSSDNGGESDYGDNAPLRGAKHTLWEGGIKVPAFITGGLVPESQRGTTFDDISYVCDWYPTLLSIAGIYDANSQALQSSLDTSLDGTNLHAKLFPDDNDNDEDEDNDESVFTADELKQLEGEREIVYSLHNTDDCEYEVCGSIRVGKYKLLIGGENVYWNSDNVFTCFWDRRYVLDDTIDNLQCGDAPLTVYDLGYQTDKEFKHSDEYNDYVNGDKDIVFYKQTNCDSQRGCLFDIESDPCEYTDISKSKVKVATELKNRLKYYKDNEAVTALYDAYGEIDISIYNGNDNLPPMVDDDGYWAPWVNLDELKNGELDFETNLRKEKEAMTSSSKKERVLNNKKDLEFLGTATGSAFNFGNMHIEGVFYAFLVILAIALVFASVVLYKKRQEWKIRQSKRGSALLARNTVRMYT